MKTIKIAIVALFCASVYASNLIAQSDIFGKIAEPKSPVENSANTAIPKLLNGERNGSGSASESSESNLESRQESAPTFLRNSNESGGFSAMQGAGLGTGSVNSFGTWTRIGYVMPNGLYLGGMAQLNVGSAIRNPQTRGIGTTASVIDAVIPMGGIEIGYEIPVRLLGITFFNRSYFTAGMGWVNFSDNVSINPDVARISSPSDLPQAGINLFAIAGNLFYYHIQNRFLIRNLSLGVDARYLMMDNANSFGILLTAGVRIF